MYEQFYGLRKSPFNLTPDPEFLYLTPQYKEALAILSYSILAGKGIVVLTGNAGTGKTTLLTQMLEHFPKERIQSSLVTNPTLSPTEFLEAAMLDFGFTDVPASKAQRLAKLQSFLYKVHREGRSAALIVDEAHKLSLELLEEIRLFGNFESANAKLLQIVLVGQPELDDLLAKESLRQFKQRIALRASIGPLNAQEVGNYIQHRWRVAGGTAAPFSAEAVAGVGEAAMGIPRLINVTCDNALLEAYGEESATVEMRHVAAACAGLRLGLAAPVSQNAATPVATAPAPAALPVATAPAPAAAVCPIKTFERYYSEPVGRPSFWGRLRIRLRPTERIETA